MPNTLQPGERVAYSAQFLRSIGCHTGGLPAARGVVVRIDRLGSQDLAVVQWDNPDIPARVLACNLARVGANRQFCACD